MSDDKKAELNALQESAEKNKKLYNYDKPNPELLESFPTPEGMANLDIKIDVPEFTSLCPVTGQPDSATITITYRPDKKCVESKSLKLYLMGFRMFGEFHENCCQRIASDLSQLLDPVFLEVRGDFFARGGISINPTARFMKNAGGVKK